MTHVALACFVLLLVGCAEPSITTDIKGDREVVQVSAGRLRDGGGDNRMYYIIRDKDTGVDYLAVVDAGIVELKPKPQPQVEKSK